MKDRISGNKAVSGAIVAALVGTWLVGSRSALAQGNALPDAPAAPSSDLAARLDKLEKRVEGQDKENAELRRQLEEKDADIKELRDARREALRQEKLLQAWGFLDVTFARARFDNPRALYQVGLFPATSFFMNGINLYLKSELPSNFSVLTETRFTFTPNGTDTAYLTEAYLGDQLVGSAWESQRVDTTTRGALTNLAYRQSGLLIERAHVDYKPYDELSFRFGRWLTPFGVWNEDHGSPVLIGIDNPQLVNYAFVPIWQTGLQVYGGVELAEHLRLEYTGTLSNGRGPMDEVKDLDANKALGVRAKLVYENDDLLLRAGGYFYDGDYTDLRNKIVVHVGADGRLDPKSYPAFENVATVKSAYHETIATAEAEVRFRRLRLVGEFARRAVTYSMPEPVENFSQLLAGDTATRQIYMQNYLGLGAYGILAYELVLPDSLGGVRMSPYVGYDFISPNSVWQFYNMVQMRGGLNVKPTSNVTLKAEAIRIIPESKPIASNLTILAAQLAVAF